MEEFNLLESLEDIVDQLGRGKISDDQAMFVLNNIVNFKEGDDEEIEYRGDTYGED